MTHVPALVRPGVRLGVDVGSVRIGVARSDGSGSLAVPVETVDRSGGDASAVARIVALAGELEAMEVLVGHPISLDGSLGPAARAAADFAAELVAGLGSALPGVPVLLVDERLTTVSAQRSLSAAGRTHRGSRSVIDQQAAVIVVQHALDSERVSGAPVGTIVGRRET